MSEEFNFHPQTVLFDIAAGQSGVFMRNLKQRRRRIAKTGRKSNKKKQKQQRTSKYTEDEQQNI